MATWKEGDRVRVVRRPVTEEDRRKSRYFDHMADLTGTVQQAYSEDEVAVRVDPSGMTEITADVVKTATQRMRDKFVASVSEEQRKQLTKEELEFDANYVLLVRAADLEAA